MRVAIENRKIPGVMYATVMPNYTNYFARILSELGSPLKNLVTFQRKDYLPGGIAVFELTTPDYFTVGGGRPQYNKLTSLLRKQIQQDLNKQSGLVMMDIASVPTEQPTLSRPLPTPGPGPAPAPVTAPGSNKPTIPFEEGKDLEITWSDAAMQASY